MSSAWQKLIAEAAVAPRDLRIPAYSEFMPAPWVGIKPSGEEDPFHRDPGDGDGWLVSESEIDHELEPGLRRIAKHIIDQLSCLALGRPTQLSRTLLTGNPAWPPELAERTAALAHERFVLFMENYDIRRSGYHDMDDTMKNIDLDYAAAIVAIAIETVADCACAEMP